MSAPEMKSRPAILPIVLLALIAGCDESVRSEYATKAEAEADGLFERGWLPEIIPPTSRRITLENDLDLNHSNGEFQFEASDHDEFIRHLTRTPASDKNGFSAYSYEDWTFWINPDQKICEFHMRLTRGETPNSPNGGGQPASRPESK